MGLLVDIIDIVGSLRSEWSNYEKSLTVKEALQVRRALKVLKFSNATISRISGATHDDFEYIAITQRDLSQEVSVALEVLHAFAEKHCTSIRTARIANTISDYKLGLRGQIGNALYSPHKRAAKRDAMMKVVIELNKLIEELDERLETHIR
ncbi:hypothetical protein [Phaeobacter sp. J2-8]|uniref:hypothetical protein n=1 Tax=Phaeobacter sp. J2-8 TaxID=2931394 RepID=UPI001FD5C543|nr:hypothetical protein [Phaeobacter sp. J2-8]MCJ7871715.1 hypothetical protein [Phaeobacter sp. J2-8]